MYTYAWYQWLAFFYLYCFFGWIFESGYVSIKKRRFVNRGFLRIPMIPIYGSGAILMLWVSIPFRDNLIFTWISGFIGATALEYVTGYLMEQLFKVRYWDYSGKKYNLNGYICLSSSIAWGFLTIFMTHLIHTPIEKAVLALSPLSEIPAVSAVTVVFVSDAVICTREALAFGKALEALHRVREGIDNLPVQAGLFRMETADRIQYARAEAADKLMAAREEAASRAAAAKAGTADRLLTAKNEAAGRLMAARSETLGLLSSARTGTMDRLQLAKLEFKIRAGQYVPPEFASKPEQLRQLISLLREKEAHLAGLFRLHGHFGKWIFRSNPTISSHRFAHELASIREYFERGGKSFPDED